MTSPPLRLAFDAGPLYGHRTGVGVAADGMLRAIERRGDVALVPYLASFRSTPLAGHRRLPVPGLVASHLWSRFDHPRADRWLGDVDVVHGTNYVAPPTRLATVISVYDCWFLANPGEATPVVRRAGAVLRRAVARGAWVHTSSEHTAATARRLLGSDRVVAVHLGPPPAVAAGDPTGAVAGALAGQRFVVAIATEERRKALPMLVRAFDALAGHDRDTHLVLAGARGDESDRITAAVSALDPAVAGRVHRLGPVDEATKAWLLGHAAVLAYPSLDEGFGFPVLEAQSVGTPVVASSAGSIPEVAGPAAVVVDDRRPEAFADALWHALTDAAARRDLIEAGHRNVERFSWDRTADGLVGLYHRALDAPLAPGPGR